MLTLMTLFGAARDLAQTAAAIIQTRDPTPPLPHSAQVAGWRCGSGLLQQVTGGGAAVAGQGENFARRALFGQGAKDRVRRHATADVVFWKPARRQRRSAPEDQKKRII